MRGILSKSKYILIWLHDAVLLLFLARGDVLIRGVFYRLPSFASLHMECLQSVLNAHLSTARRDDSMRTAVNQKYSTKMAA
jgi:hypothetical protein